MVEVARLRVGSSKWGGTPREGEVPALGGSLGELGWREGKGLEKEGEAEGTKPGKGEKELLMYLLDISSSVPGAWTPLPVIMSQLS